MLIAFLVVGICGGFQTLGSMGRTIPEAGLSPLFEPDVGQPPASSSPNLAAGNSAP
jgi:hypothetical protein